jgi:hypothetical protein
MRRWVDVFRLGVVLLAGCGGGPPEIEEIPRVPAYVLTPDDLRGRVGRLRSEIGVATEGVLVHGRFTRVCGESEPSCVAEFTLGGKPIPVVVVEPVQEGRHYVLRGAVVAEAKVPDRWVLRANVLAVVRDP